MSSCRAVHHILSAADVFLIEYKGTDSNFYIQCVRHQSE